MNPRVALLLLSATGCSSPPPCTANTVGPAYIDAPLFVRGEPFTARFVSGLRVPTCFEGKVNGAVLDSNNDPIEGVTWKTVETLGGFAAELSFTPQSSEPYFVTVRFEPNLGLLQGYLSGAARSTRPVLDRIAVTSPGSCPLRHVSPLGTSWCADTNVLFGALRDARLYALNEAAGPRRTVFSGATIWLSRDAGVERWVERSDAGYEREPNALLPNAEVVAATETEGFGAAGDRIFRYGVDAGQWQVTSWLAETAFSESNTELRWLTAHADAGLWWWADYGRLCANPTSPGGARPKCFELFEWLATERDGIWSANAAAGLVNFTSLDGGVLSLAVPSRFTPLTTLGPFAQHEQLLFASIAADGGLQWEILSDHSSGVAWIQGDRLWYSTGTELVALPRYSQ